ncbi:MAG TPA: SGNH/GDSL hydrolase family protein [Candidatus Cybelea sp.]|nr:SGNH/GDSL hydrolase family protein [Candidatus Cybelea sp.]
MNVFRTLGGRTRTQLLAAVLIVAGMLAGSAPGAVSAVPAICAAPEPLWRLDRPLPHTALKLREHRALTIVAIGSSSTAGNGASTSAANYPSRLGSVLSQRYPETPIRVLNRGVGGEVETQMEARFQRDVVAYRPDLVIWQIGTNSVIRDRSLDDYRASVEEGIAQLKAIPADVILMNPQYAPRVLAHPEIDGMLADIAAAAKAQDVSVFDRFSIMRYWIVTRGLGFDRMVHSDALHMNDLSYGCMADLLADAISAAVAEEPKTVAR